MKRIITDYRPCLSILFLITAMSLPAAELRFSDFLQAMDHAPALQTAVHQYEKILRDADNAAYHGDISLGVSGSARHSIQEEPDQSQVSGSLSLRIPLGRSTAESQQLESLLQQASLAAVALEQQRLQVLIDLYDSYRSAYLAQEMVAVLQAEAAAQELRYTSSQALYQTGAIAMTQLLAAQQDLFQAQQDLEAGYTEAEIARLQLKAAAPMEHKSDQSNKPMRLLAPQLDDSLLERALPRDVSLNHHPSLLAGALVLEQDSVAEPASPLQPGNVSFSLSSGDQRMSASYSFSNPALLLAWTPPPLDIPSRDGGGNNSLTLSLSAGFDLAIGSQKERDTLNQHAELERVYAEYQLFITRLELAARSAYQRYQSSRAGLEIARSAMERAEFVLSASRIRDDLGQETPADRAIASAAFARAQLQYEYGQLQLQGHALEYIAAIYQPELLPELLFSIVTGAGNEQQTTR